MFSLVTENQFNASEISEALLILVLGGIISDKGSQLVFGSSLHICDCRFLPTFLGLELGLQTILQIEYSTDQFVLVLDQLEAMEDTCF